MEKEEEENDKADAVKLEVVLVGGRVSVSLSSECNLEKLKEELLSMARLDFFRGSENAKGEGAEESRAIFRQIMSENEKASEVVQEALFLANFRLLNARRKKMTTQFFSGCDFLSRNGMGWGTGSWTARAASAPSEDSDTVAPCARRSTLAPGKKKH